MRDIRSLDLNLLKTFVALLDEGSVTRAADRLGLTQPAVSGMLGRLRDSFDDPLFIRTRRGILPTTRANALAGPIRQILSEVEALLQPSVFDPATAELTVSLLEAVQGSFGKQGIERLLKTRTQHQIETYKKQIPSNASLSTRLKTLARLRSAEGYMAETQTAPDGSLLLIENHCPICAAATACTGLCDRELEIFQTLFSPDATVERTEHLIAGERRCAYRVSALASDKQIDPSSLT